MKKIFETPAISIDAFAVEDVITVSVNTGEGGTPPYNPFAIDDGAITPKN